MIFRKLQLFDLGKKIFLLGDERDKKKYVRLIFCIILMGFIDMLGVASVFPFINILTRSDFIESNTIFNSIYDLLKFENIDSFKLFLGIFFIFFLVFSIAFKAIVTLFQIRFSMIKEFTIGKKLLQGYLNKPYSWFLNQNSANLGTKVLSEVGNVVSGVIVPYMNVLAQISIAISIFSMLLIINPIFTICSTATLLSIYFLLYYLLKNRLVTIGKAKVLSNKKRFSIGLESFNSSKEVKLLRLENYYVNKFSHQAKSYANNHAMSAIISQMPRFMLEALVFGSLLVFSLVYYKNNNDLDTIIPMLSVFAFAAWGLMPALQQIYIALTQIKYAKTSLDIILEDLTKFDEDHKFKIPRSRLKFSESISLQNVSYKYPKSERLILKDINLSISAKSSIGIMGETGSGKSTLIDVILGLLIPQQGRIDIDDKYLTKENNASWQKNIGYVPQQIYLSDDSLMSNVAFGVEKNKVDFNRVVECCKQASLHDFIINDLEGGYDAFVGERGVKLSGGQRQRVGIARALYRKPSLLIFDEATSALDNKTEEEVIRAVDCVKGDITIIMIAHRLNTLRHCDHVYTLEKGSLFEKKVI